MEFHVSRQARDLYQFDQNLFSFTGNVIFANLAASRQFAHKMNQVRGAGESPERTVRPGALYAMGLIDEMSHALVDAYRKQLDPSAMQDALAWFDARLGKPSVDEALLLFVEQFPTVAVYRGEQSSAEWLRAETAGIPHRAIAFEEMALLWLANANPAFKVFSELFEDEDLAARTGYPRIVGGLREYFSGRPPIGPDKLNLIDMLRAPALAHPDSLSAQLAYIREKWAAVLGSLIDRLILALDVLREEDLAVWMQFHPPSADELARRRGRPGDHGGYADAPTYSEALNEYEHFSPDQEWMPTTVLIAKSTYVWLEQLSRKFGRHIYRLDQIPDEELSLLARHGLNALWLIGIWERSRASQTIKQLLGNPDAVASAYSLYGYSIAEDLGGEAAYRNLRDRASAHGIRLASDMVPNHMGIDSSWVLEHPEWFLSRSDSPYPSYTFDGPDLSSDGRVEIKIEDHYYNLTDAAVVFRRRDKWTGDTRYIYHGNDGTSFPWNDTAQLDYLNPATREQVIQAILHVARLFPIIRFDAAMTLARRHVQRLWFPLPGSGGAIPSRAESSMSQAQFNEAMPFEFWREVVDRVAREVPGTLLLAEAFWLMEGYFVRTLGMHRVYNSAFMVMVRDEDNAKYRLAIRNTIEFDPEILKRYVNFMSNPDERTAIDQFGRDDKYFGAATLVSTLPGLPMFAHGQIEGFTEKYGMEFRRPRYQEDPDAGLVERHEREIAPLLHRRWLFAEVENFRLYDFYRADGTVDENVFAYSNRCGGECALVIYHNCFASTSGSIHHSAAYLEKHSRQQRRESVREALGLPGESHKILAFRDSSTGLEHLGRAEKIATQGLNFSLRAYERHVFLDWRELEVTERRRWDLLCGHLDGRGVENLERALQALEQAPLHNALLALFQPEWMRELVENPLGSTVEGAPAALRGMRDIFPGRSKESSPGDSWLRESWLRLFAEFERYTSMKNSLAEGVGSSGVGSAEDAWALFSSLVGGIRKIPFLEGSFKEKWSSEARSVIPSSSPSVPASSVWSSVVAWCVVEALAQSAGSSNQGPLLFDSLNLREAFARAFDALGVHGENAWRGAARVRVLLAAQTGDRDRQRFAGLSERLWSDPDARWLLHVHRGAGDGEEEREYFSMELHEQMLWWLALPSLIEMSKEKESASKAKIGTAAPTAVPSARGGEQSGSRNSASIPQLIAGIAEALLDAKQAGYRTDRLGRRSTFGSSNLPSPNLPSPTSQSSTLQSEEAQASKKD